MAKVIDQCCICAGSCPHVSRSHVFCQEHKGHEAVIDKPYSGRYITPINPVTKDTGDLQTKVSCPCGMTIESNSDVAVAKFLEEHDGYHAARITK